MTSPFSSRSKPRSIPVRTRLSPLRKVTRTYYQSCQAAKLCPLFSSWSRLIQQRIESGIGGGQNASTGISPESGWCGGGGVGIEFESGDLGDLGDRGARGGRGGRYYPRQPPA